MNMRARLAYIMIGAALLALLTSCRESGSDTSEAARADFSIQKNLVDTMTLTQVQFSREIISNGTLKGVRRAELKFEAQGQIAKVNVRNGSRVGAGAAIASLSTESLENALQAARQSLEKARLDFYDNIIGYGYGSDTSAVPRDLVEVARVRSGYASAELNLRVAERNLREATLRAPFGGVVANLTAKPFEQSSGVVCTIIDNSSFEVQFPLLESEMPFAKVGQKVFVSPFIDPAARLEGTIKEVNPLVDERGQVSVTASVRGTRDLVEGMNVKVFIESDSEPQLVVPKSAVVMRDGYDVIFTLDTAAMKAQWLYVDILQSNSTHHAVSGCKKKNTRVDAGLIVITDGNLNLADGSNVEIRR